MASPNGAKEQHSHDEAALAAHFSYGFKLVHTRLREFAVKVIESKDSHLSIHRVEEFKKTHYDFNQTIYFIQNTWIPGGFSKLPNQKILWSYFQRATVIRNFVAHQETFPDINSSDRGIETLCHIVKEIGFPDDAQRIRNYNKPESAKPLLTWEQLKQKGNDHYKDGRYTEAMISYTKALKENPDEPTLYSNRALCEINLNRLEDARNDAEDALELDPKNVKYYRILSEALHKMELLEEAMSVCQRGLQLDSKDEVLLIRARDLKAFDMLQLTNRNPSADPKEVLEGKSGNTLMKDFMHNLLEKYNDLKPSPSDIRYVSQGQVKEHFAEYFKIDGVVREGHNYRHGMRGCPRDEHRAFELFKKAADMGNAEGQYNVGMMFEIGCGTNVDYALMLKYYRLAADHKAFIQLPGMLMPEIGVAEAENALGNVYRNGTGVDVDMRKAFSHYIKGAGWGQPGAQNNTGWCLQWEQGVAKNLEFARTWYKRAAEQDLAEAQLNYAEMLDKGEGGPRDESKAFEFYKKAADQGSPGAIEKLHRLARNGSASKEQQESFDEMLWKKSANGKDPYALYFMGNELKEMGDFESAVKYYKKAAEKGHLESKVAIWEVLLDKLVRNAEAFSYCSEASTAGDARSQITLAMLLLRGIGCKRDPSAATRWFQRAQHRVMPQITMEKFQLLSDSAEQICKFEEDNSLATADMKWIDRVERHIKSGTLPSALRGVHEQMIEIVKRPQPVPINMCTQLTAEGLKALFTAANNGSRIAQDYIRAQMMVTDAFLAWDSGEHDKAFSLLRQSHRYYDIIKFQSPQMIAYIDKNNIKTADALFVKACNFYNDVNGNADFLERCIRLYPTVADFHHMLACCHGFNKQDEAALTASQRAYELEPRPNWLYTIATAMRQLCEIKTPSGKFPPSFTTNDKKNRKYSKQQVIAAYETYLRENPKDERKVPAALFCIALMYAMSGPESMDDTEKARIYYEKACAADASRLACFEPVEDTFPPKVFVKMILQVARGYLPRAVIPAPQSENVKKRNCDQCGKANPPNRCICRTAVYCDRECQKLHWRVHKLLCSAKAHQLKS